jgi:hypothetical protein
MKRRKGSSGGVPRRGRTEPVARGRDRQEVGGQMRRGWKEHLSCTRHSILRPTRASRRCLPRRRYPLSAPMSPTRHPPTPPRCSLQSPRRRKGKRERRGLGHGPPTPTAGSGCPPKGELRGEGSRRPLPAQLQQARVRPRKGSPPHPTIAIYQALPTGAADLRRAAHMPPPLRLRGLRARRPLLDSRTANWGREYACADGQGRTGRDVSVRQRKRRELGRGIERGRRRTLKVAACSQCGRRI